MYVHNQKSEPGTLDYMDDMTDAIVDRLSLSVDKADEGLASTDDNLVFITDLVFHHLIVSGLSQLTPLRPAVFPPTLVEVHQARKENCKIRDVSQRKELTEYTVCRYLSSVILCETL